MNNKTWLTGLIRSGISPNKVTWAGFLAAMASGCILYLGKWGWGCLLVTFSGSMDILDGYLARNTNTSSQKGTVLDSTLDRYSDFFVLAGLALFFRTDFFWLLISLLAILGSFMTSYSSAKAEAIHLKLSWGSMKREQRWFILSLGLLLSFLLGNSLRPLQIALALVAVLSNILAIARLHSVWRAS